MRKYGVIAGMCAALTLMASTASAQNADGMGLTLSSGAIGFHIPVGERAAIRPTLGLSRTTSDYEGSQFIQDSVTSTTIVPGISLVFSVKQWDATRLYVSPQYEYARHSTSLDGDDAEGTHGAAFMLGVQHGLGARFAVFAETGLGWSRSKSTGLSGTSQASVTTHTWRSQSAIGGILFF